MKLSNVPLRLSTGAFILNSGITKRDADQETIDRLHGFASSVYPPLKRIRPEQFVKALSTAEIALGAALLAPVVPATIAGTALSAFSAGLLGLYVKTPGMTRGTSVRPTNDGTALAKDSWMLGIGVSLIMSGLGRKR
ncbi:MAG TPA: hypothetical protein VIB48_16155 [Acidimicrobiia bacterium]|jgi:hypothetical protein